MPFDSTHKVVYGDDARRVPGWARDQIVAFAAGKLNDAEGPYYTPLGLDNTPVPVLDANGDETEETQWARAVEVSKIAAIIDALYKGPDATPVVFVAEGAATSRRSGKRIDNVHYEGRRWSLSLNADSGVRDASPESSDVASDNVAAEANLDNLLACYVTDIFSRRENRQALHALGLADVRIQNDDESQRAGMGRNPRLITCDVLALDDYAP
jgi:hypothetical protein